MKHLQEFVKEFKTEEFKVTNTVKQGRTIHQTQRNAIRKRMMDAALKDIAEALDEVGLDAVRIAEGIGIALQHENHDPIGVIVDFKFKSLDYDVVEEGHKYQEEIEKKAEEARLAQIAKEKKKEEDRIKREAKLALKELAAKGQ